MNEDMGFTLAVSLLSEETRRTHLLTDDQVLTLSKIIQGYEPNTYTFYFTDEEGRRAGCLLEFQLPDAWVEAALLEMPPC